MLIKKASKAIVANFLPAELSIFSRITELIMVLSQRKPSYKTCTEKFTARGMSQPPWCRKAVKSIELTFT